MWKNFRGTGWTREKLLTHLSSVELGDWCKFVTFHNTAGPTLQQWLHGGTTPAQRILNLESYYEKTMGWHAGPNGFVPPDSDICVYEFTDFAQPGVHASCFNSRSVGIEMVGDYSTESFDTGPGAIVRDNAVFVGAALHLRLGLRPLPYTYNQCGVHFHVECRHDNHDCPGRHVDKADFVGRIVAMMNVIGSVPGVQPVVATPQPPVSSTVPPTYGAAAVDHLNLRSAASAQSAILGQLPKGARVEILGAVSSGSTQWYHVKAAARIGFVAARYIRR